MRYLASDEMMGRATGSNELKLAARYLAEWMRRYGVESAPNTDQPYLQPVPLVEKEPHKQLSLTIGGEPVDPSRLAVMYGGNLTLADTARWIAYGSSVDFNGKDLEGSMVMVEGGYGASPKESGRQWFAKSSQKQERARDADVAAIIEFYNNPDITWLNLRGYLNRSQLTLAEPTEKEAERDSAGSVPHLLVFDPDSSWTRKLSRAMEAPRVALELSGKVDRAMVSYNVAGMVEGSDPKLKDEYIVLTAHYDHLGVGPPTGAEQDSIFNGARDNGIGMVAMLNAARNIGAHPLKRSVLFLFVTAEEKGLIGSGYYVDNPLIPLQQTVFNANIDGGGYNDTTIVTVVGMERVTVGEHFTKAAETYGLEAIQNQQPELGFFRRSDNIHFARQGIPAPTFTQGFRVFDEQIQRYYHNVEDEVETLNFRYLNNYYRAYNLAVRLIGNDPERPWWQEGQPYLEAARELYGSN